MRVYVSKRAVDCCHSNLMNDLHWIAIIVCKSESDSHPLCNLAISLIAVTIRLKLQVIGTIWICTQNDQWLISSVFLATLSKLVSCYCNNISSIVATCPVTFICDKRVLIPDLINKVETIYQSWIEFFGKFCARCGHIDRQSASLDHPKSVKSKNIWSF